MSPVESELELLLWAVRRAWDPEAPPVAAAAGPATSPALRWPLLREAAVAHGLVPQLARHLPVPLQESMPAEERVRWSELARANARRCLRLTTSLLAIAERFDRAGIGALSFKGPVLARLLYGDVAARAYCDLDLLVRREDVAEASRILESLGIAGQFRGTPAQERVHLRNCHALAFISPESGMLVDLHWRLFPHERGGRSDPEDLFRSAQSVEVERRKLLTLGPEETLIHLCAHGADDRWGRLGRVADVAALLAGRSWDTASLLERAEGLGRRRSLLLGLILARETAGAAVPPELAVAGRSERGLEDLVGRASRGLLSLRPPDPAPSLRGALFQTRTRDGWRERFQYLRDRAFLPVKEDLAAFPLPPRLHPLYTVLRPMRLARCYGGGWLRELFRQPALFMRLVARQRRCPQMQGARRAADVLSAVRRGGGTKRKAADAGRSDAAAAGS